MRPMSSPEMTRETGERSAADAAHCPLCGAASTPCAPYAWRCTGCGVAFSSLEPHIEGGAALTLDEQKRAAGLRAVRDKGHAIVLDAVAAQRPLAGLRALDVGSGHGWFLEAAAARGIEARGIEPDRDVAATTLSRGLDVRVGFFPDDLPAGERFDLITFNDVLEHLPDLPAVLEAVRERLLPTGLLAIGIPTAEGLGYRTAMALARLGVASPRDRLWQRDLPSPHLWYFTERSLVRLIAAHGFELLASGRLPSVERDGLRERIDFASGPALVQRLSFVGVSLAAPLLNQRRFSDAMWVLCRRPGDA